MDKKLEFEYMDAKQLVPYARNAKKHSEEQIAKIMGSIQEFGFIAPIIIDKSNNVLAGHGRLLAAQRLGLEKVPCIREEHLTDTQRKAYILADNRISELATWDEDMLKIEIEELKDTDFDLDMLGFDDDFLKDIDIDNEVIEEDEEPIKIDETPAKSKLGDLWILGNHRLLCGDATKTEDIEKLIKSAQVDLVLTDPPYGISIVKNNNIGGDAKTHFETIEGKNLVKATKYAPIKNDDTTKTAELSYKNVTAFSKNQIIFGGNYFTDFLPPRSCWLVWDKENSGNFADVELAWTSFNKGAVLYKWLWNGLCRKGNREIEGKNRIHPTQKPVGLLSGILTDFSKSGDAILDVFGGSGSTLIACEQLNRKCHMMEIEPKYCDVIIRRWQKLTGQQAILESNGKSFDEIK